MASFAYFFIAFVISSFARVSFAAADLRVRGVCPTKIPPLATVGDSCGVPPFVDTSVFGSNEDTNGVMKVFARSDGVRLTIVVDDLPKPDLVLTAWLIWTPFGVTKPRIFKIANHASPCAPYNAPFATGLGMDPNRLTYKNATRAKLSVDLNFNPTMPCEGALTRETFSFQKDVVGIQGTRFRQPKTPGGVFIPTSSSFLRKYDEETGFELLDANGFAEIVRSPVAALGVEIVAHTDKATHGVSQGVGGTDHYFLIFFPFTRAVGAKTGPRTCPKGL